MTWMLIAGWLSLKAEKVGRKTVLNCIGTWSRVSCRRGHPRGRRQRPGCSEREDRHHGEPEDTEEQQEPPKQRSQNADLADPGACMAVAAVY